VNVFYVSIRATENYEFDKIRTAGVTENAISNYKNSQGDNSICSTRQVRRQRGPVVPGPPFEVGSPSHFTFGPPGCCIHPILHFKNVTPFLFFCPSIWFLAPPAAKSWRRACNQRWNFAALPANFTTSHHCWTRLTNLLHDLTFLLNGYGNDTNS